MLLKQWILFVALCVCSLTGKAQTVDMGTPPIHHFSSQIYKAHSQNWSAVQDARGVMYFGNTTGIVEYDGARWRQIETPSKTISRALAISPSGTIFYGSVGDFGYLKANENGKVQIASLRDKIDYPKILVLELAADRPGDHPLQHRLPRLVVRRPD